MESYLVEYFRFMQQLLLPLLHNTACSLDCYKHFSSSAQTLILLSIFAQAAENSMHFPWRRQIRFSTTCEQRQQKVQNIATHLVDGISYSTRPQVIKYHTYTYTHITGRMGEGPCYYGPWLWALSNFA